MPKTYPPGRARALLRYVAIVPAYIAFGLAIGAATAPAVAQTAPQPAPPLTLEAAIARAVNEDPSLKGAAAGIDAARGGLRQARANANPEFSAEVENFNGRDDLRNFQSAETTYSLSQQIDLLGQRGARVGLADREVHAAELGHVVRGLDLIRDVQVAFFEALAAQSLVEIARERLSTAQALNQSVVRRVSAARDPLMAGARAQAGLAEARIALNVAAVEAVNARARLSALLGSDEFTLDVAPFALTPVPDHTHAVPEALSPDLARATASREQAAAAVRVEKSIAWQNPTLSVGYRRFEERRGEGAFIAGFSMPLGIANRNQGGIARAEAIQRRAEFDLEAARRALLRDFAELQRGLATGALSIRATEQEVIPQAERALTLARDGYDRGGFSYLDVLEAQRALSDSRQRRIEALKIFHVNEASLDRLTARFANAIPAQEIHR